MIWTCAPAREATVPRLAEVMLAHAGGTGVAFAWEMQLLRNSGRG